MPDIKGKSGLSKVFNLCFIFLCFIYLIFNFSLADNEAFNIEGEKFHKEAVRYAQEGNLEQAIQLIKKALEETGDIPKVISDYVVILSWAGQSQQAVNIYEQLPQGYNLTDYALPEIAKCYRVLKDYEKAIKLYKKYLDIHTENKDAFKGLIYTYLDANQLDNARKYIIEQMDKDREKNGWLEVYLGDILFKEEKIKEAEEIYTNVLKKDSNNIHAQLGLSKILTSQKKLDEVRNIMVRLLDVDRRDIETLFYRGELLELQKDYLAAYDVYKNITQFYPDSQNARNLKYRVLMDMGSNSLARDELESSGEQVEKEINQLLWGNEAMTRINWGESDIALEILKRNKEYAGINKDVCLITDAAKYPDKFILRTYYDEILAKRQIEDMLDAILEYEDFRHTNLNIPIWITASAADAYLYSEQPEKALSLYNYVYEQKWDPQYGNTRMSIYYTMVELGKYKEAREILENLDKEVPVQIVDRGVIEDNWRKEEIAYNRGWLLLYQDRLAEAQKYFSDLLMRAPFNTHSRIGLAHTYLWRDWPRLSLEEFEAARTMDPKDIAGEIGYCYALDKNDYGKEARILTKELLNKYPKNKHVQKLNRYFIVEDMPSFTLSFDSMREDPGVNGLDWSLRIDQPLFPWRKIFTGFIWKYASQDSLKNKIRRGQIGLDWRLNRDWWFVSALSLDKDGRNFGHSEKITFNPNDYLSFSYLYDSYSLSVPLRARTTGIEAREWVFTTLYRQSESFLARAGVSLLEFSDTNDYWSCNFKLDRALTTEAYWKTRLALEGYRGAYSKTEVSYFSPKHIYSLYLVPEIEHVWYRRYEKSMVERFFVGFGAQWQAGLSAKDSWYVHYEQDYKLSDTFSFLIGTTFSQKNYDGADTKALNFNCILRVHF